MDEKAKLNDKKGCKSRERIRESAAQLSPLPTDHCRRSVRRTGLGARPAAVWLKGAASEYGHDSNKHSSGRERKAYFNL